MCPTRHRSRFCLVYLDHYARIQGRSLAKFTSRLAYDKMDNTHAKLH